MKYAILPVFITIISFLGLSKTTDQPHEPAITVDTLYLLENNDVLYSLPQSSPLPSFIKGKRGFGMHMHPVLKVYKKHEGIDITCPTGTELYAQGNGRVTRVEWGTNYGKLIDISHGMDSAGVEIKVRYAHLSEFNVKVGDFVKKGQLLGLTGNTGRSTGPHLHYEYHVNSIAVDPVNHLSFDKEDDLRLCKESKFTDEMYKTFHQLETDSIIANCPFLRINNRN